MKKIIWLAALALFCMGFWVGEILVRNWMGLEWLNYFHWSMLIVPIMVIIWIIKLNGKLEQKKHFLYYPLIGALYTFFTLILVASYPTDFRYNSMVRGAASSEIGHYLPLILFPAVIFLLNLWVARIEHRKLSLPNKIALFFSSLIIPALSILLAMLLFTQSYLFPSTPPDPIRNGMEPIHWLKSGSLIFAVIIYEGAYFLWLKGKFSFKV